MDGFTKPLQGQAFVKFHKAILNLDELGLWREDGMEAAHMQYIIATFQHCRGVLGNKHLYMTNQRQCL
jgi:hypothetical protein